MDFSIAEPLMLKYGITHAQITELKALAAKLPSDVLDGTRMPIACIPGLNAVESELLMARMLDAIAPAFGVAVPGGELLDLAGCPSLQTLMRTADHRQHTCRRSCGAIGLELPKSTQEGEVSSVAGKRHLHA